MQSAVRIARRQARQRSGFFAADAAELRHSDDELQCGSLAQAGNARDESEPAGEICVTAQRASVPQQLARAPRLQPRDVVENAASEPRILDMLEADFEPHQVLLDLLD